MTQSEAAEHRVRRAFLLLFVISGFSGLIYQSIWTHYLKLFLGHAAFAQTLVLIIFMGGLALGSWLASRLTPRLRSPLLVYALTELLIGFAALAFHPVFVALTAWSQERVFPLLASPLLVDAWKWALSGLLILPQSVLLGATFPLMCAGLARRATREPGRVIAGLYFANSLGAAVGVLVAGFVLIAWAGLPGTLLTAAVLNIVLGLGVYVALRLVRHDASASGHAVPASTSKDLLARRLLLVSMLTGTASFVYEIGWIRMLSLVLGSSTHAFELMLSAFITGLALGGFWIRRHVDHIRDPELALGRVQVLMGLLAMATVALYGASFDLMRFVMKGLQPTEQGYTIFNLASHTLALAGMLPATICAGMTLPIITHLLLVRGGDERAIGRVYAVNTLGAILGVLLAVLWWMPYIGLAWTISVAALIDVSLGVWLLVGRPRPDARREGLLAAAIGIVVLVLVHGATDGNIRRMASGVFLQGNLLAPEVEVVFHHDGRTATIDVVRDASAISILTNGKSDAALMIDAAAATDDEATMTLLAALPLMSVPQAKTAAVIGLGSGMSTHTLLGYAGLERVDTVEIESGMVSGARLLGPKVERAFTDARSRIYIEDARTFLTSRQQRYDLIVSEPSNIWVSGVAGLFSVEFYRSAQRHIAPGGVLAQWFHVYQVDVPLVASVATALAQVFPYWRLHMTSNGDALFLASGSPIAAPRIDALGQGVLRAELARIGVHNQTDVDWTWIGDADELAPFFASYGMPANSDFFPLLDLNAVRTRFMQKHAWALQQLGAGALFGLQARAWPSGGASADHPLRLARQAARAEQLFRYWDAADSARSGDWPKEMVTSVELARLLLEDGGACDARRIDALAVPALVSIAVDAGAFVAPAVQRPLWEQLRASPCTALLHSAQLAWLDLQLAFSRQDDAGILRAARALLPETGPVDDTPQSRLALRYAMQALLRTAQPKAVLDLWQRQRATEDDAMPLRVLAAQVSPQAIGRSGAYP